MFDWFRKFIRKVVNWLRRNKGEEEALRTYTALPIIEERFTKTKVGKVTIVTDIPKIRQRAQERRKELKIEAIRKKNRERQRSTLGHGLKSKFFKPRPAYEKQNWRLDKKPEDDD